MEVRSVLRQKSSEDGNCMLPISFGCVCEPGSCGSKPICLVVSRVTGIFGTAMAIWPYSHCF